MADAIMEGMKIKFDDFFERYYRDKINDMIIGLPSKRSLLVNVKDLELFDPDLASELINRPDIVLEAAYLALKSKCEGVVIGDTETHPRFFSQSVNTPLVQDVGAAYIGKLILLDSLVVKRSEIIPRVHLGAYKCSYCDAVYKFRVDKEEVPEVCPQCKRKSLKDMPEDSKFINLRISLHPPGRAAGIT